MLFRLLSYHLFDESYDVVCVDDIVAVDICGPFVVGSGVFTVDGICDTYDISHIEGFVAIDITLAGLYLIVSFNLLSF